MGIGSSRKSAAPVQVAVIGEGLEADRLAAAYRDHPNTELAAFVPAGKAAEAFSKPGLRAAEIAVSPAQRLEMALQSIGRGLFTSVEPPGNSEQLQTIDEAAARAGCSLRMRMFPFYYPPYRRLKELVDRDMIGRPINLKLSVKWGKGFAGHGMKPVEALRREIGFLALAPWIMGPVKEVYARLEENAESGIIPSPAVAWKHEERSRYGYLQLDFCPQLHIRTDDEPVHRTVQITGLGGIATATRGEGQLMRMPALTVRGKNVTTSFETVPDRWSEVYTALADELAAHRKIKPGRPVHDAAFSALRMIEAAMI